MPIFDFQCPKCKDKIEKTFIVSEKVVIPKCFKCKKKMKKLIPNRIHTSGFERSKMKKYADNIKPPRPEDKGLL